MFVAKVRRWRGSRETGYVLLSLLLMSSMLVIAAAVAAPSLAFSIRRDREEELIHRGAQYRRAIRHFYEKTGRYPNTLEELQSTNGIRFLRKQYKDPLTGKAFKLLRYADVEISDAARTVVFTQSAPDSGEDGAGSVAGAMQSAANPASARQNTSKQADLSSSVGGEPELDPQSAPDTHSSVDVDSMPRDGSTLQGGGPIVGVVSQSNRPSIREFNHKGRYNDWLFYFDSGWDYGPINGPTVNTQLANGSAASVGSRMTNQ